MKVIDNYKVNFENLNITISILEKDNEINRIYEINIFEIEFYTFLIVEKIKEDLLREGIFENIKNEDYDYENLKKAFITKVRELLNYYFPGLKVELFNQLLMYLVLKSLDLGFIDLLVSDSNLEEIVINGDKQHIMIYHRRYGWLKTNLKYDKDEEIKSLATRIALENRKNFSNLSPLLDAHLRQGHRVNATLSPISTKGTTITIRRFSDKPWTVTDLMDIKTVEELGLAIIWLAIENEYSIIISGGTGSGKTSFLNAVSCFIPPSQRIISIEDTREIRLPDYSHWVPLEARASNQEGKGEVSILDLIVNSLRMRPDRIIIGEIRRKKEAEVLFEAMRTGHSVYGTFHANTAEETVLRLTSPPIEIPKFTLNALGLIVVQHRDRKTGKRRTLQIAEIDDDGNENVIFQLNPKTDKLYLKNKPVTFLRKLKEFQGMNLKDFMNDLKEKIIVLKYLKLKNINDVNKVGEIIARYYIKKEDVLKNIIQELKNIKHIKNKNDTVSNN